LQNRIADAITRFAGSMAFVDFHIVWFAVWIDEQWKMVQEEDQQNKQLIELSKQILELTRAVHAMTCTDGEQPTTPVTGG
jgi:hypothetical protein